MSAVNTPPEFDTFANNYDAALNQGLALSGENKEFFARGRIHCLARRLAEFDESPGTVLDYGCGTGTATPHFFDILGIKCVVGLDVSPESLTIASRSFGTPNVQFHRCADFAPSADIDLAFTNGVFHHIPPDRRHESLLQIHAALRPGGLLAFWENNPWNPGTRMIMRRIPFDRDAILVWPHVARRLLRQAGFQVLLTDFAFIFPNFMRFLRPLERRLCKVALGGQYMVLARK